MKSMRAFTLIEMLVVIGIIAILSGIVLASLNGSTEGARNAQCLTNMKNLASACQSYGMASSYYPLAGSIEALEVNATKTGGKKFKPTYYEIPGWISWYSNGAYDKKPTSSIANDGWNMSAYTQDKDTLDYCFEKGALYSYLTGNRNTYRCPTHRLKMQDYHQPEPAWSYVMNAYFGWQGGHRARRWYGRESRADRRLLFAEMQWRDWSKDPTNVNFPNDPKFNTGSGTDCDCVLQYPSDSSKYDETIGFNHSSGKKNRFAHVVFADGHAEKLAMPKGGIDGTQLSKLTEWLCEGKDVSFDGRKYEEAAGVKESEDD